MLAPNACAGFINSDGRLEDMKRDLLLARIHGLISGDGLLDKRRPRKEPRKKIEKPLQTKSVGTTV